MKQKNTYYRRQLLRCLKRISRRHYVWSSDGVKFFYDLNAKDLYKLNPKMRKYAIIRLFSLKSFIVFFLFFFCSSFAFQGVGDCEKLLSDYAQLMGKSVFIPRTLSGECVVNSEKHLPLILKSAGFDYKLKDDYIQVSAIDKDLKQNNVKLWKPKSLYYDVTFVFVNMSNVYDCGLKMGDVIASTYNLDYDFSFTFTLGCPALDSDGSFAFHINAHLIDKWYYSHGNETLRTNAQITSSTGAVTNQYEYVTTGLNLSLEQNEKGVFYTLKYTGNNGSVTTSSGGVVDEIRATIKDEYTGVRKFAFLPIGKEKKHALYTLVLRIVPRNV